MLKISPENRNAANFLLALFVLLVVFINIAGLVALLMPLSIDAEGVRTVDLSNVASNVIGGPKTFCGIITNVSGSIVSLVGFLAILMFVWAAILYITSGGSAGQIQRANTVLKYAVIGIAIVLFGKGLITMVIYIIGGGTGTC